MKRRKNCASLCSFFWASVDQKLLANDTKRMNCIFKANWNVQCVHVNSVSQYFVLRAHDLTLSCMVSTFFDQYSKISIGFFFLHKHKQSWYGSLYFEYERMNGKWMNSWPHCNWGQTEGDWNMIDNSRSKVNNLYYLDRYLFKHKYMV